MKRHLLLLTAALGVIASASLMTHRWQQRRLSRSAARMSRGRDWPWRVRRPAGTDDTGPGLSGVRTPPLSARVDTSATSRSLPQL